MSREREAAEDGVRHVEAGMPRWLKVIAIVAAVLVALFVILLVTGGPGGHGPGRHMSKAGSGASGTYAPVVLMQAPVGGSLA